jgi:hypothetical protein
MNYPLQPDRVRKIYEEELSATLATMGLGGPEEHVSVDAAVIYVAPWGLNLLFGSFEDTKKTQNLLWNPEVALTIGALQIRARARVIPRNTDEYSEGRKIYDARFPRYMDWFERERNQLYILEPRAIWRGAPEHGMMARELLELEEGFAQRVGAYEAPLQGYPKRG